MHHLTLWERACPRRWRHIQYLHSRHTAFASKPAPTRDLGYTQPLHKTSKTCGSGLAREDGGTSNICMTDTPLSRASPLPHVSPLGMWEQARWRSARRGKQMMPNVTIFPTPLPSPVAPLFSAGKPQ